MNRLSFWALATCFLWIFPARAEPLKLEQVLEQVTLSHPRLLAAERRYEAARIRARYAGAILNPTIQLGESGRGVSEETVYFRQGLELAGQPGLRAGIAARTRQIRSLEVQLIRRELAIETGRAYLDLWHAQQRLRVHQQRLELYRSFEGIARRRFEVGELAQNQYARTVLETRRVETDLVGAKAEVAVSESRLRFALGSSEALEIPLSALAIPEAPLLEGPPPSLEALQQTVADLPEMTIALTNSDVAQLETELSRKEGSPQLALQFYRSNLFRTHPALEQGVQLTLNWVPWDYGQIEAEVATREGEAQAWLMEAESLRRSLQQKVESIFRSWEGAQSRRELLRSQVKESLRLAEVSQKAFDSGFWSLQESLDAQRTFRDAQLEYLQAETEFANCTLELQWLLKRPWKEKETCRETHR